MDDQRKLLIKQINESPEPLRSYIHGLEVGCNADVIWQSEERRLQIKYLQEVTNERNHWNR